MIVGRGFGKGKYLGSIVGSGFAKKSIGKIIVDIVSSILASSRVGARLTTQFDKDFQLIKEFILRIEQKFEVRLD